MTAIETRFLGPTNFRGSRYKATASGSNMSGEKPFQVTLEADDALDSSANHRAAATALIRKMGWTGAHYATWYEGGTATGYVYVCAVDYAKVDVAP